MEPSVHQYTPMCMASESLDYTIIMHVTSFYGINRNFSEDLILSLLARLFGLLKLYIANNTFHLDIM